MDAERIFYGLDDINQATEIIIVSSPTVIHLLVNSKSDV